MTLRQAFAGLLQLTVIFLFFGAGFFFTSLRYQHDLRIQLADLLLDRPDLCTWTGMGFFAITLFFCMGFYGATKGRYLLMRSGNNGVRIGAKILHKTISEHLHKHFSSTLRLSGIEIVKGHHLFLNAFIDPLEPEAKAKILLDAERLLVKFLAERFGYTQPFTLQVVEV